MLISDSNVSLKCLKARGTRIVGSSFVTAKPASSNRNETNSARTSLHTDDPTLNGMRQMVRMLKQTDWDVVRYQTNVAKSMLKIDNFAAYCHQAKTYFPRGS